MIPLLITIISGLAIGVAFCAGHWYHENVYKVVNQEQKGPAAGIPDNYNMDYCNLLNTISKARNINELKLAKRQVNSFGKRYKYSDKIAESVAQLRSRIHNKEIAIGFYPTVLS